MLLRNQFTHQFFSAALPMLEKIIFESYDLPQDLLPELFNMYTMDKSITQSSLISGFPVAPENEEGAPLDYENISQEYSKTYTALKYRIGVKITEEMLEDGDVVVMRKLAEELGKSMKERKQIAGFSVLNNGFSDTGPDAVALFSASHPLPASGGTDSNTASADLAVSALRTAIQDMRDTRNSQGLRRPKRAKKLIVPIATQWLAGELIGSPLRADNAENAINTFPNLDIVVGDYITLGNGTWFLLADKNEHTLNFFQRTPMKVVEDDDFDADAKKMAARERFVFGYDDWRGIYGSQGA